MRATISALVSLAVLASSGPADARIYRWVAPNGVVTYSDQPPQPSPVEGARDALIDEALEIAGIKRQLEGLPAQVKAGVDLSQSPLPPKERAAVVKVIGDAFRPAPILATLRSAFQKNYDPLQMGLFLAQLRSPTARKMAAFEGRAADADMVSKLRAFTARLKDAPPAPARVARLAELDAASGSTEFVLELRVAALTAVFKVVSALMPPEKRPGAAAVESAAKNLVGQQREAARQEMLLLFLYVYREATDEELDEYVGVSSGEPGRWFQAIYHKGLIEALSAATESAMRQVARMLPPKSL
jgi:hypothetical protein